MKSFKRHHLLNRQKVEILPIKSMIFVILESCDFRKPNRLERFPNLLIVCFNDAYKEKYVFQKQEKQHYVIVSKDNNYKVILKIRPTPYL